MTTDDPGSPPDSPSGPARRSRRAGRTSESYEFRARFGDPSITERQSGLREPVNRPHQVPGRERVTVRELMEQMAAGQVPPAQIRPGPAPSDPARPPVPPLPQVPVQRPAPVEDTQWMPPVESSEPAVDLSQETTTRRAQAESRGQVSPVPPAPVPPAPVLPAPVPPAPARPGAVDDAPPARRRLEPTPNLTAAFKARRASKKSQRPAGPSGRAVLDTKAAGKKTVDKKTAARYAGRTLVALSCVMVLFGTGYMWNIKRGWDGSWNTTAAINSNDPNIRNKDAQYGDETYLIVGTDSRFGKNAQIGGGDTDTIEGIRADTILLVNIPADRSRVVAVSWPRDLQVDRPACAEWDPATGDFGAEVPAAVDVKLNSVYATGGPPCLVKTLTKMSGLNINHFIAMDFEGFEKVVNAIGGVYVCSTVPLYDYELGYILRSPGTKKLTGKRALNYVRARNISAEGNGDYGRIKRQQLFMSALLRSTLSSDVLTNPTKLNKIVNTFIQYSTVDGVDTDSLIQLANSMQGVDAGRVTFLTIPTQGTSVDGENNEIPRTDDIDTIFNAIIDDKPLPGEKKQPVGDDQNGRASAPAETTAAQNPNLGQTDATAQYPANVSVRVLNGSGTSGVARDVMDQLISYGFNVPGIADASDKRADTVVRYGPGEKDSAATIAKMFPGARIQEDRTVKVGVEVILGSDYAGTTSVGSPPTPGSTVSVAQLPQANTNSDLPNDLAVTNAGDTTCS